MQRGARDVSYGGQVSELQKFLSDYYDIDPEEIVTGFFGRITQGYVQQFQRAQGLPSFGIAGSMTRATIAKVCTSNTSTNQTPTTNTTQPNTPSTTYYPNNTTPPTCAYTSSSTNIPRGVVFNGEKTAESCKRLCLIVRNEVFGLSDGGSCEYKGANGIGHAIMGIAGEQVVTQTSSEPTCKYTSNSTGQVQGIAFNTDLAKTADSCKYICTIARNEKFGPNDSGTCIYTGANGVGQSVMPIQPVVPVTDLNFVAGAQMPITLAVGQTATDGGIKITLTSVATNASSGGLVANMNITVSGYQTGFYSTEVGAKVGGFSDPAVSTTQSVEITVSSVSLQGNSATLIINPGPPKG
jgi:peptidoglycan hydrolase-like protein with peptidoglycan-binding domain